MFSKYTIALAALLLVGGSSIAVAIEDVENKLGDRYPMLQEGYRSVSPNAYRLGWQSNQGIEDIESKIGDRYPALDASYQSAAKNQVVLRRTVMQTAARNQTIEDVENKITDRYPFLAQSRQFASARTIAVARTMRPAVFAAKKSGNRS